MKKELFVCDTCSTRKRLNGTERHWCEVCNLGAPIEMRHVRDKKPQVSDALAAIISPVPTTENFAGERNNRSSHLQVTFGLPHP